MLRQLSRLKMGVFRTDARKRSSIRTMGIELCGFGCSGTAIEYACNLEWEKLKAGLFI